MSCGVLLSRLRLAMLPVIAVVACGSPVRPAAAVQAPTAAPVSTESHSSAPYEGPAVAVTLNQNDGAPKAVVKVTFPTGGWELKHDSSRVKDRFGVAHFTFTGPAPDDMVAQVLEEKTWAWESAEHFSRAEVWVRIVRRGQTAPSDYRLAAKAP
jgi:hypothetical protein